MNIGQNIKQAEKYLTLIGVFLIPLFYLPVFTNPFETPKLIVLFLIVFLLSLSKLIRIIVDKEIGISTNKLDVFIVLMILSFLLSTIFASPAKMDALLLPGTASFVILGSFLYFFINQLKDKDKKEVEVSLVMSSFFVGTINILSFTKLITPNFTTMGSLINSLLLFIATLPISLLLVAKSKGYLTKGLFSFISFVIFISLFINTYEVLPGKNTKIKILDQKFGWSIAVDSLKVSPFLGMGPGNFIESYNKFRPIETNSKADWDVKYLLSSNTFFNVASEVGLIATISLVILFVFSINKLSIERPSSISLLLSAIVLGLLPISASGFVVLFILLSLQSKSTENKTGFDSKTPGMIISLPIMVVLLIVTYFSTRAFLAEYYFNKSLVLLTKNDAVKSYELMNKTIKTNPFVDRYHLAAADMNSLISQSLSKKKDLSDEDKKTIANLIQQSIREAKAAAGLNPRKSSNWEKLGDIYNGIVAVAKDADNFALQSYNQAVYLDPINPNIRIKAGGIYYYQKKYTEAIKVFELAVLSKPDFANAHYNLAMAYKENKQLDKAKEQMNITLKLVGKDSADYETAKKELETIEGLTEPQPQTNSNQQLLEVPPTNVDQQQQ